MSQRTLIYISLFVVSTIGSWLGALVSHGNWFGVWSFAGGTVGAFIGVWVGYKLGKNL